MTVQRKPIVALTIGDPGGIGPEIVARSVGSGTVKRLCTSVVVGDPEVLAGCRAFVPEKVRFTTVSSLDQLAEASGCIPVINPCDPVRRHRWGTVRKDHGRAAMAYVRFAVGEALAGRVDGIVTAPLCKEAIHRAGYSFKGHTDYLAHLTGARRYAMMLMGRGLRVVLVTVHIAMREVSRKLSRARILTTIVLANEACIRLGLRRRRVAVCALNPHAGEGGAFGKEEIDTIVPAIRMARRRGIDVEGPFPADTLFVERNRKSYDVVVAMYHDQGLIPLKMLAFDVGVNVTLGLPVVRTSPDHGTAFDIAGKGMADPRSMIEAIKVACEIM
jgi:4-hydroxythreonine-4-phosphate dehydrogenase